MGDCSSHICSNGNDEKTFTKSIPYQLCSSGTNLHSSRMSPKYVPSMEVLKFMSVGGLESLNLKAIWYDGAIRYWTFRFSGKNDSPHPGTYIQKAQIKKKVEKNFNIDEIHMRTYRSGQFTALYMIEFASDEQVFCRAGSDALSKYEDKIYTLKLGELDKIVSTKVTVARDRKHASSVQYLIY